MRKILVVTYVKDINYGAVLQSYATDFILKKFNIRPVFLNIRQDEKLFRDLKDAKTLKQLIAMSVKNLYSLIYIKALKNKHKKFSNFVSDNIELTKEYQDYDEICMFSPKADLYMTGSDQMFNTYSGLKPAFYLDFLPDSEKKFSYATSMGNYFPAEAEKETFLESIRRYQKLSVREIDSKEYFEKEGILAYQHIDPTLLLGKEKWGKLVATNPIIQEPYLLVYNLNNHPLTNELIKQFRKENKQVVCLSGSSFCSVKANRVIRDAGPIEFLNLFKYADQIITTSYHGVCFSLIFEKDFYALVQKNEKRITSLLRMLGLDARIVEDKIKISENEIEWKLCRQIMNREGKKSEKYLEECLYMGVNE